MERVGLRSLPWSLAWRQDVAMVATRWRTFFEPVEGRGISDPLAALFRGKGIDEEVGRADKPLVHRSGGLDGQQVVHQGLIKALAKLGEDFGQDKMLLSAVPLDRLNATAYMTAKSVRKR